VRTDQDLPLLLALQAEDQRRQLPYDRGVERQLGLLQQERRVALQQCPEQTDEPQRTVGELILALPSGLGRQCSYNASKCGTPVSSLASRRSFNWGTASRSAFSILLSRDLRVFSGVFGNPFQEVTAEWIVGNARSYKCFGMPEELRDQVQVEN